MKMAELASDAPYWTDTELYNLAVSSWLSENRDELRKTIRQLAARLYVAQKDLEFGRTEDAD